MTDSSADQDPVLARISEAYGRFVTGDKAGARDALGAIAEALGPEGDPLHRCVVAHYMADAQDDPAAELHWDLEALKAAERIAPDRPMPGGVTVEGFYPSLHLNAAESHRRVGQIDEARRHAALAERAANALGADGYGAMIRAGIARLHERLAGA